MSTMFAYASPAPVILLLIVMVGGASCAKAQSSASVGPPDPLQVIPTNWIDLPDAPFVAGLVDRRAVLVNRTKQTFDRISVGCVRPVDGVVTTVHQLFGQQVYDSAWLPGAQVEGLLAMVNNIDFYIANEAREGRAHLNLLKRCPEGTHVALTSAAFGNRNQWKAEGASWPR